MGEYYLTYRILLAPGEWSRWRHTKNFHYFTSEVDANNALAALRANSQNATYQFKIVALMPNQETVTYQVDGKTKKREVTVYEEQTILDESL